METIIANAEIWTAGGTWATFLVLTLTLYFVYKQVSETATLRREQTRPYVVVSIDVEQRMLFMLTVENVGATPAFDIVIEFDTPLRSSIKEIEDVRMFKQPIPMLPPGRRFRAAWESSLDVFGDNYPHPLSYQATVRYTDHQGHEYGPERYVLDFRVYEGQATGPKGINELVRSVDDLLEEHKKWTDGIGGLSVHTLDTAKKARRDHRPHILRQMKHAYQEEGCGQPWLIGLGCFVAGMASGPAKTRAGDGDGRGPTADQLVTGRSIRCRVGDRRAARHGRSGRRMERMKMGTAGMAHGQGRHRMWMLSHRSVSRP